MERVAIAGLSLHQSDADGLELLKRGLTRLEEPIARDLADRLGASEAVLISTCNRLELVYARENGHAPTRDDAVALGEHLGLPAASPLGERIFLHTGRAAARHLFRVAASLDSLVLGEDQILAQVREAWTTARESGLTGPILNPLFELAVQLGKRVRTRTDLSRRSVSVVSLGVGFVVERLAGLADARVAVIGAGATGTHAARVLAAAGFAPCVVANRDAARARTLADEVGAEALTLDELRAGARPLDALVSATSAPGTVVDAAALARLAAGARRGRRLVVADLALPRDVAPADGLAVDAIDLETLRERADENRTLRAASAAEAELLIEEQLARLFRERAVEAVAGPYSDVVGEARNTLELELGRLLGGRLAHLDPRDRLAVERWARVTFGRLAHAPYRALKRMAAQAPPGETWEGLE